MHDGLSASSVENLGGKIVGEETKTELIFIVHGINDNADWVQNLRTIFKDDSHIRIIDCRFPRISEWQLMNPFRSTAKEESDLE